MRELESCFVMLVGLPGSGKSTFAKELKINHGYTIISSDEMRKELFNDVNNQDHNSEVFDEMLKRTIKCLQNGEDVVYDATNFSSKKRIHVLKSIEKYTNNRMCYFFSTPYEMCLERNEKRERKVPEEVIKRLLYSFQVPSKNEGFTDIQIIYPEDIKFKDYNKLVDSFKNIAHNNPYHSETIGKHMRLAEKQICKFNCDDQMLILATLLHDIGKPETKFIDKDGIAHYYNHENVGAYRIFELNVPEEFKLYIALLVNWHMKFFQWHETLTPNIKAQEKALDFLGLNMYCYLIILALCDQASSKFTGSKFVAKKEL